MNDRDIRPISTHAMVAAVRYHRDPNEVHNYLPNDMFLDNDNRSWIKASAVWARKRRFRNRVTLSEFTAIAITLSRLDVHTDEQRVAWLSSK